MTPQHFDNIALALALLAIALRYFDRPWAANLCSSLCIAAATTAGWLSRRPSARPLTGSTRDRPI